MSPTLMARNSLQERYVCDLDGFCFRTPWDIWGRWVAFAIIVVIVISLAYLFSHKNNQRRLNNGLPPMYGTGWIPAKYSNANNQQSNIYAYHDENNPPAPPYTASQSHPAAAATAAAGQQASDVTSQANNNFRANNGEQNESIELTQPEISYQPRRTNEINYEPPPGPPPLKKS